jgi:hypothetical protein
VENPVVVAASGAGDPANFCKELRPEQRLSDRRVLKALTLCMNFAYGSESQWQ